MFRLALSFIFIFFCHTALSASTVRLQFEVMLYKKTCEIDVSQAQINYDRVTPLEIIQNDSGEITDLNRDVTLRLINCAGTSDLSRSKIFVSGRTETINGQSLFKEDGTSQGVGVKLIANDVAKTDSEVVFDLTSSNAEGDLFTVTTALSCGDCTSVDKIKKGSFRAALVFSVFSY